MNISQTLALAALQALGDAQAQYPGIEAAGALYQCEGGPVVATPPQTSNRGAGVTISIRLKLNGCPLVGVYHTHPAKALAFSPQDIAIACRLKVPSFMEPADGLPVVFDCRGKPRNWIERAQRGEPRLAQGREVKP